MSKRKERQQRSKQKIKEQKSIFALEPKTVNQQHYFKSIEENTYTFVTGPAGTGKSLIAFWYALKLLDEGKIAKIIIIRPMVEVKNYGEQKLGSLPGDVNSKILSWVLGVFDNSELLLDMNYLYNLISNGIIEFSPLALCRGRTFHNSCVIVEEAQNISTDEKGMQMVLTRLGLESKMIINGDLSQKDLGTNKKSALEDAITRFKDTPSFGIVKLGKEDIQRNANISIILDKFNE